ncbi:OmpW family protein [Marimonas sp. MJW-29]|uniref:OmpW family protein n=1 Tax=Sulfitobacter sediminis TaxID=3234186 RepID=A0ABV3RJQ8_9RHOB
MRSSIAVILLAALGATSAAAQSQGDWTLGLGLGSVMPKSGNGTLAGGAADVGDDLRPVFTAEYFIRDNLGIELLASTPFEHDVDIAGVGYAGSTKHLPPTLSLNYHFPTNSAVRPYVGAGITYVTFFEEQSPLGTIELDDSFGLSVQAGIDYELSPTAALRANVRWMDVDSDVSLDGVDIGTAEIDPVVVSLTYLIQF